MKISPKREVCVTVPDVMLCFKILFTYKNERFNSNHMFQLDQCNAGNTCCTGPGYHWRHTGKAFTNVPVTVACYVQSRNTEQQIVLSNVISVHEFICLFISCQIENANKLLSRTPRSYLCYQVCCEHYFPQVLP